MHSKSRGIEKSACFGDICKDLGRPEFIPEAVRRYRVLKEKYGSYGRIKEGHRDEIAALYWMEMQGLPGLFAQKEQEYLDMAEGLEDALEYLDAQGITLQVITEMKKTLGPVGADFISTFLKRRGLVKYFKQLITPQGKINLEDDSLDLKYKGKSKKDGSIYVVLIQELEERGIKPGEAVIIGDKPETDINPAHDLGFHTIQYTGYIDLGESKADFVIHAFSELINLLKKGD